MKKDAREKRKIGAGKKRTSGAVRRRKGRLTTKVHIPRDDYSLALQGFRERSLPDEDVARLFERAHGQGDARATYALATWYLHGRVFKKNTRTAVRLLKVAARKGVPDSLFDLAVCYANGEGVVKSDKRAACLFLKAALIGDADSCYELYRRFYYGFGVAKDRRFATVFADRADELDKIARQINKKGPAT